MLQSRSRRREDSLDEFLLDPIIEPAEGVDPVEEAVLADSVGRALIVVLNRLSPAERLAFVLHDMFAVPFDEIAPMVGRSDAAVRQLASRARRRVRAGVAQPVHDLALQRAVVDAFFAAARLGDLAALIATLDPDVVLRTDQDTASDASAVIRGAREVAERAVMFADPQRHLKPTLVNGAVGVLVIVGDRLVSIMRFMVHEDKVVVIEAFLDPDRLKRVHLSAANE